VIDNHWMMAGHISQIPGEGDYFLFEVAGESIILVRGTGETVHAHYNVCRHRGSRVLLEPHGKAGRLICRYHGWAYAGDGSLTSAPNMPEGFERCEYGLKPCHVCVLHGLILISLSPGAAPELTEVARKLDPVFRLHGIDAAAVAQRRHFPIQANWKLTLENYLECYHCKPAHPQYCRVEVKVDKTGDGSPAGLRRYDARYREWRSAAEERGCWLEDTRIDIPLDQRLPRTQFCSAYRAPLREGYLSATENGQPAAVLMGGFSDYDGGETALGLGPFSYMLAYNDHAVFFQFVPQGPQSSELIVNWLVDADARESDDYDCERLTWLWAVTSEQDKAIIEANAAGIRSSRYEPGPASLLESDLTSFRNWYLALIGPPERLEQLAPNPDARYFGF
jgi:Rieske 2Fe-2S family protein